jgi:Ca2+-dependent lipid-binding protein
MENMSRDKVEHYYLLTTTSWCRVCHRLVLTYRMPHGIHTKRTPMVVEHNASRYQMDMLMQYQIGKKGPYKNLGLTSSFVLCLSMAFGFFLSFHHCILCMITKGPAWSALPITNTKRLNFCEKTYKILTSPQQVWGLRTLAGDVV